MGKQIRLYIVITLLLFHMLFVWFAYNDLIYFGHGLGGVFFLFSITAEVIFFSLIIYFQYSNHWKMRTCNLIIALLVCTAIYYTLSCSVWRGAEYDWDGKLFH